MTKLHESLRAIGGYEPADTIKTFWDSWPEEPRLEYRVTQQRADEILTADVPYLSLQDTLSVDVLALWFTIFSTGSIDGKARN